MVAEPAYNPHLWREVRAIRQMAQVLKQTKILLATRSAENTRRWACPGSKRESKLRHMKLRRPLRERLLGVARWRCWPPGRGPTSMLNNSLSLGRVPYTHNPSINLRPVPSSRREITGFEWVPSGSKGCINDYLIVCRVRIAHRVYSSHVFHHFSNSTGKRFRYKTSFR